MGDFAKDVNLRHNKLKNAKVDIPDRNNVADDDAIDAKYVQEIDVYETTVSANASIQPTNEILDRTKLHQKGTREIFDELFYPLVLHTYLLPTVEITARFVQPGTSIDIEEVPGVLCDVQLDINVTLNDSQGIDTNQIVISGDGIVGTVTTTTGIYTISNYNMRTTQSWDAVLYYKTAVTQNDTHGNTDPVGDVSGPYFTAGSLNMPTVTKTVYWPWYATHVTGDVAVPSAATLNTLLSQNSGRHTELRPDDANLEIPADSTKTIFFAIPITGITLPAFAASKDGHMSVTPTFTGTVIFNTHDATNSGEYVNYAVWRATTGVGYTNDTIYTFNL